MKVAGIAGGVGTTVVATLLGAEDCGLDVEGADIVVARNDYRCAKALVERCPASARVLLIMEPERSLQSSDFVAVLGRSVLVWNHSPMVAQADDAGLLPWRGGFPAEKLREMVGVPA